MREFPFEEIATKTDKDKALLQAMKENSNIYTLLGNEGKDERSKDDGKKKGDDGESGEGSEKEERSQKEEEEKVKAEVTGGEKDDDAQQKKGSKNSEKGEDVEKGNKNSAARDKNEKEKGAHKKGKGKKSESNALLVTQDGANDGLGGLELKRGNLRVFVSYRDRVTLSSVCDSDRVMR